MFFKPLDFIKSWWFAYRYSKGKFRGELYQYDAAIRLSKIVNKANPIIRKLLAKGLKEHRTFEVEKEWIEAKQFYETYFKSNPDIFKSREEIPIGSWVTVIGHEEPIKGERHSEYYTNWYGTKPGTYRVRGYSKYDDKSVDLHNVTMSVECLRMHPATAEEIDTAKSLFMQEMNEQKESTQRNHLEHIKRIERDYQWLKAS